MKSNKAGVFVGRVCPIHLGHEEIIKKMIEEFGTENSLVIIGSSNSKNSLRNFFSYKDRRGFLKKIFPNIRIVGLPDYNNDEDWLLALDDILIVAGIDPKNAVFFGGCEEDIRFFLDDKRQHSILNRFEGGSPKISATEVRDALIHGRDLSGLLNPTIIEEVQRVFKEQWEMFKKL